MTPQELEQKLEAVLFYKGEPVKRAVLAKAVGVSEQQVVNAIHDLQTNLEGRGIRLVSEGEYVGLATAPEVSELIAALRKEELEGPLGKAGLETLAIVIYKGPLSRAEIDYIRGVNSSSILRSLTMRGLIEKVDNPKDKRSYLYRATPELPAALGLSSLQEAPEFEKIQEEIATILEEKEKEDLEEANEHDQ